jgi:CRISPR locus-related DNA-binding protein
LVSTASSGVERRILVFTLGFDASAVIARFSEIEVKGTELVFLVPAKSTDRSENTILSLQQFINSLNLRGQHIAVEFIRINENLTDDAIQTVYTKLAAKQGRFTFDLSGGLRVLVLIGYTVAQLLLDRVDEVSLKLESSNEKVTMPLFRLDELTDAEYRVLEEVDKNRESTQRKIALRTDRKISSVSRVLYDLESKGLVFKKEGKPSIYSLTKLGNLMLQRQKSIL